MSLVGYNPESVRARLTPLDHSCAGALSGAVTRVVFQPLDVAKIRLQLQVETGTERKYRGPLHLLLTMPREEGISSLWKGHVSAQLLSVTYGVSSFLVFEMATKQLYRSGLNWAQDPAMKPVNHFICGSLGGFAGTVSSLPFDVLRTRMVAQPEGGKAYSSVLDAARKLHQEGGPRAFFKGFSPTVVAIAPQAGLQFGFYSLFTQFLEKLVTIEDENNGLKRISMLGSLSCGGLAGLSAKAAVYPLDTAKKRLQTSGWSVGRRGLGATPTYTGLLACLGSIVRQEGRRGLYKGLSPALLKSVLTTSLHFWLYEHFCYLLALRFVQK